MTTDAQFWDALAERYAAKPVDDAAAFDRTLRFRLSSGSV